MRFETINTEDGISYLKKTFGKDIKWDFIDVDPKKSLYNLLISPNIDVIKKNIITGERADSIKITTTDPNDTSVITAQLVYCLDRLRMKTEQSDKLKAYIETYPRILYTQSPINDAQLKAITSNTDKSILDNRFKALDILDILTYTNTKKLKPENGVFAGVDGNKLNGPRRNDTAIFQLDTQIPPNNSNLYRGIFLSPGSILFPIYSKEGNKISSGKLIAHAWSALGTGKLEQGNRH